MPLFSIIVTTYDRPEMLSQALESVRQQSFSDFECIVVEDAPPTSRVILPADPRFKLVRHERNKGVAAARNTGVSRAKGQYVLFLDDDDLYPSDRLEASLPYLSQAYVLVCARRSLESHQITYRDLQGYVSETILEGFTPHMGQATVPRSLWREFDETYVASQDIEWWLRTTATTPLFSISDVGYVMRSHDGQRHGNGSAARANYGRKLLVDYETYFRRHRRARAFRWERVARLEAGIEHRSKARAAARQAVLAFPAPRAVAYCLLVHLPERSTDFILKRRP